MTWAVKTSLREMERSPAINLLLVKRLIKRSWFLRAWRTLIPKRLLCCKQLAPMAGKYWCLIHFVFEW